MSELLAHGHDPDDLHRVLHNFNACNNIMSHSKHMVYRVICTTAEANVINSAPGWSFNFLRKRRY
jgi:hypothetical protein